jgi:hypothetical protein
MKLVYALVLIALPFRALAADSTGTIPSGSKVYVREMDGFGSYITTAISKKRVQVVIVSNREMADYEIGGGAGSRKVGLAERLVTHSASSTEAAGIDVTNLKTSMIVFSYKVNKHDVARGKQSAAEACARRLRTAIAK